MATNPVRPNHWAFRRSVRPSVGEAHTVGFPFLISLPAKGVVVDDSKRAQQIAKRTHAGLELKTEL